MSVWSLLAGFVLLVNILVLGGLGLLIIYYWLPKATLVILGLVAQLLGSYVGFYIVAWSVGYFSQEDIQISPWYPLFAVIVVNLWSFVIWGSESISGLKSSGLILLPLNNLLLSEGDFYSFLVFVLFLIGIVMYAILNSNTPASTGFSSATFSSGGDDPISWLKKKFVGGFIGGVSFFFATKLCEFGWSKGSSIVDSWSSPSTTGCKDYPSMLPSHLKEAIASYNSSNVGNSLCGDSSNNYSSTISGSSITGSSSTTSGSHL